MSRWISPNLCSGRDPDEDDDSHEDRDIYKDAFCNTFPHPNAVVYPNSAVYIDTNGVIHTVKDPNGFSITNAKLYKEGDCDENVDTRRYRRRR